MGNMADQNRFWFAKCRKMANSRLLFIALHYYTQKHTVLLLHTITQYYKQQHTRAHDKKFKILGQSSKQICKCY